MDALVNGVDSKAEEASEAGYKLFQHQYADSELADSKWIDWIERNHKNLVKTPQFRQISEELLESRIVALRNILRTEKSRFLRQKMSELEKELTMRRMNKAINLKVQRP
jgi:hypothetical protein